jgi:7,8-dihydropterin-6-yl-methyl-4-(beta-D-ribofuranosyl)aminobenzene 5'-phosphate synthase
LEEDKIGLRIITLSENTTTIRGSLAEHGLSILIEMDDINVLLDTGSGISATHNADILDIDLTKIDKIVLSHGHHDHTGGLRHLLRRMKKEIEIIAHPHIWASKYSRHRGQKNRYGGIPFQRQELESLGANFTLTTESVKLTDSIMTTGEIAMVTDFEEIEPNRFFVKEETGWQPDKLLDDQALLVNIGQRLIVILGCAHRGIINTLCHAKRLTSVAQIQMVIGGCHLINASQERIGLTVSALRELGIQKLGVSHCTGMPATVIMAQEFRNKFFFNNVGTVIDLS